MCALVNDRFEGLEATTGGAETVGKPLHVRQNVKMDSHFETIPSRVNAKKNEFSVIGSNFFEKEKRSHQVVYMTSILLLIFNSLIAVYSAKSPQPSDLTPLPSSALIRLNFPAKKMYLLKGSKSRPQ
jgi:hypothetical protein